MTFISMFLLSTVLFIVSLIRPNWIKFNTKLYVSIAFGIIAANCMIGVHYIDFQDNKDAVNSQTQTVFGHKQSIEGNEDQKNEKQTVNPIPGAVEDEKAKEIDRAIKEEISAKVKVEVSVDSLIMDTKNNTKFNLVIINNSDYQINKMKLRISLKDPTGKTVDDYDCEILQPVYAHGVLGDTIWMNAKGVANQKTYIAILEYSKPAQ